MALKSLREEGFDAVGFERRDVVGGLWAYSDNSKFTSVLENTVVNLSKFVVSLITPGLKFNGRGLGR